MFHTRGLLLGASALVFFGCAFGQRGGFLDGNGGGGSGGSETSGPHPAGGTGGDNTHTPQPPGTGAGPIGEGGGGSDPVGPCVHGTCEQGVALELGCDECSLKVCSADKYCCETEWDLTCTKEVGHFCKKPCPPDGSGGGGPGAGGGGPGAGGGGPGAGGGGPGAGGAGAADPGPGAGGAGAADPGPGAGGAGAGGGGVGGGAGGAGAGGGAGGAGGGAGGAGGTTGTCAHNVCAVGVALDSGCDPCTHDLCAADPYCCATEWDDVCMSEVGTACGTPCSP
jgi:hypothetical protein